MPLFHEEFFNTLVPLLRHKLVCVFDIYGIYGALRSFLW
jgi:hypothetical protein